MNRKFIYTTSIVLDVVKFDFHIKSQGPTKVLQSCRIPTVQQTNSKGSKTKDNFKPVLQIRSIFFGSGSGFYFVLRYVFDHGDLIANLES